MMDVWNGWLNRWLSCVRSMACCCCPHFQQQPLTFVRAHRHTNAIFFKFGFKCALYVVFSIRYILQGGGLYASSGTITLIHTNISGNSAVRDNAFSSRFAPQILRWLSFLYANSTTRELAKPSTVFASLKFLVWYSRFTCRTTMWRFYFTVFQFAFEFWKSSISFIGNMSYWVFDFIFVVALRAILGITFTKVAVPRSTPIPNA